jgi:NAD(P)-dependent dehydrogenase (short-subunit alcohol dehydrogenase family)
MTRKLAPNSIVRRRANPVLGTHTALTAPSERFYDRAVAVPVARNRRVARSNLERLGLEVDLAGRNAIVTGAASGIGAGVAEAFARAGTNVLATDRDADGLVRTLGATAGADGAVETLAVDLLDGDAIERIVTAAVGRFGRPQILVNSAGLFEQSAFVECSAESYDRLMAINVRAQFLLTQAVVRHMLEAREGAIVFLSSIANLIGFPLTAAYGSTKGAITGLVRTLAVELAPHGIRVNGVAPGTIDTPINARMLADPAAKEAIVASIPSGRLGTAEDVVAPILFLVSDAAAHLHGQVIAIDGGAVVK